jgi:ferritin
MLVSQKIIDAINAQIGAEFGAMLQYAAISAHFDSEALPQLSAYFARQAEEEKEHAHKFIKFVTDAGGHAVIPAIPAPKPSFKKAEDAVKLSLEQEVKVTEQINHLVKLAKEASDYITDNFLQWFLEEQLEEVSSMQALLGTVRRAGEDNLLRVEEFLARSGGRALNEKETG